MWPSPRGCPLTRPRLITAAFSETIMWFSSQILNQLSIRWNDWPSAVEVRGTNNKIRSRFIYHSNFSNRSILDLCVSHVICHNVLKRWAKICCFFVRHLFVPLVCNNPYRGLINHTDQVCPPPLQLAHIGPHDLWKHPPLTPCHPNLAGSTHGEFSSNEKASVEAEGMKENILLIFETKIRQKNIHPSVF